MCSNNKESAQPFGFWSSPISASMVAKANKRLREVACLDRIAAEPVLVWVEARPELGGRCVLMLRDETGGTRELLNQGGFSVRSLINSYGGGALLLTAEAVYFVNHNPLAKFQDQRIYRLALDHHFSASCAPLALTAEQNACYGDLRYDAVYQRIVCVRERYLGDGSSEQSIVAISLGGGEGVKGVATLAEGYDFYASPALSADGDHLAYIAWNRPNMPWDNTALILQPLDTEGLAVQGKAWLIGGQRESIQQARWHSDGKLYYVSDRDNWWRLYHYNPVGKCGSAVIAYPDAYGLDQLEFGSPAWELGLSSYGFVDEQQLVTLCNKAGRWQLLFIDLSKRVNNVKVQPLVFPQQPVSEAADFLAHLHVTSKALVCIAASSTNAAQLLRLDLSRLQIAVVSQTVLQPPIPRMALSQAEAIRFVVEQGDRAGQRYAHALFYAPTGSKAHAGLPPLIIKTHGGPTSSTSTQLDLSIQFFTSRGFAVVDINYRGSSGYGRDYRQALYGRWGEADLRDCMACIDYLSKEKKINGDRVFARGQSAGGYLTLMLACFTERLCAGASTAGISNLEQLYQSTHKFEKDYLFHLLGCYPCDDVLGLYRQRSPIYAPTLKTPLLFIQGADDKVVPPAQAQGMLVRLKEEGIRAEYLLFEGEQHGLRDSDNIEQALNRELAFFQSFLVVE